MDLTGGFDRRIGRDGDYRADGAGSSTDVDAWTDGLHGRMDGRTDGWMDRLHGRMYVWTDCMDGRTDGLPAVRPAVRDTRAARVRARVHGSLHRAAKPNNR